MTTLDDLRRRRPGNRARIDAIKDEMDREVALRERWRLNGRYEYSDGTPYYEWQCGTSFWLWDVDSFWRSAGSDVCSCDPAHGDVCGCGKPLCQPCCFAAHPACHCSRLDQPGWSGRRFHGVSPEGMEKQ